MNNRGIFKTVIIAAVLVFLHGLFLFTEAGQEAAARRGALLGEVGAALTLMPPGSPLAAS